jgi:hypothetical protein
MFRVVCKWNRALHSQGFLQFADFYRENLPKQIDDSPPALPLKSGDLQEYLKHHRTVLVYGDGGPDVQLSWPKGKMIRSVGFVISNDGEGKKISFEVEKREHSLHSAFHRCSNKL